MTDRQPYAPSQTDWHEIYGMLCGWCVHQVDCSIVDGMIDMKNGGPWPEGGWVTDPGADVTCLSYSPQPRPAETRQRRRQIARTSERDLPPVCGGCAARKGSEASVSLHTRRDYQAAVRNGSMFVCHEDPKHERPCGGWCRAIKARQGRKGP